MDDEPRPIPRRGKHIGGYFDQDFAEKVAILRVRFNVDNSRLIRIAVDELYNNHRADRPAGRKTGKSAARAT